MKKLHNAGKVVFVLIIMLLSGITLPEPEDVKANTIEEVDNSAYGKPVFMYEWNEVQGPEWEDYTLTAYCSCDKCCGKSDGITASGTVATENRTIAVDNSVIPYGTEVEIEGFGTYVAEDCGSAIKGNRIDIFFSNHEDAVNFGVKKARVRVIGG